jgi:hypothetical protein
MVLRKVVYVLCQAGLAYGRSWWLCQADLDLTRIS